MTRFLDQTSLFLTLIGLTSLLVGGIGVANGVRSLARRARPHDRDVTLSRRVVGPRPDRVPDPGHEPRRARDHPRPGRGSQRASGHRHVAGWLAARAGRRRSLPKAITAGRLLRPAHRALLRPLATGPSRAHSGSGIVPRPHRPRAHASARPCHRRQRRRRGRTGGGHHRNRRGPPVRAIFLCRRPGDPWPVPSRGDGRDACGPPRSRIVRPLGQARRCQPVSSRFGDAVADAVGRARPRDAGDAWL